MEKRDYYPILESILFTMRKSVEIKTLAEALKLTQEEIKQILQDMAKEYSEKQRGIQLVFLEDSVQLCTKPQYYEYLIRIASRPQKQVLSDSVLETLSIVAYKQPVTRGEIERIRGVKSDHAIAKLMDYDLIEEIGRLDAPGRPVLFATTEEFLRCFGVSSVAELPQAAPEQIMEEFKKDYLDRKEPMHFRKCRITDTETADGEFATLVKLTYTDHGIEKYFDGIGNGPIDAVQRGLEEALGIQIKVLDYTEHALASGSGAQAASYIHLVDQSTGKATYGVGISSNITRASIRGIFSAVNRLFY